MTSFIVAGGSGRSTSVIPAVPAASSVTTIAFIRDPPGRPLFLLRTPDRDHPARLVIAIRSFPHRRVGPDSVIRHRYCYLGRSGDVEWPAPYFAPRRTIDMRRPTTTRPPSGRGDHRVELARSPQTLLSAQGRPVGTSDARQH